eukprot:94480-Prymnesium_polylepis.1
MRMYSEVSAAASAASSISLAASSVARHASASRSASCVRRLAAVSCAIVRSVLPPSCSSSSAARWTLARPSRSASQETPAASCCTASTDAYCVG